MSNGVHYGKNPGASAAEIESLAKDAVEKLLFHKLPGAYEKRSIQIAAGSCDTENARYTFTVNIQVPYRLLGEKVTINTSFTL